ncbi:response regulator transcription factor [Solimonas terrae]|uniref:Helix-turn-helix transcriptional regulator n=1 Tax=Solimonas terrae TaxID=1396819 RepID=A0A6M2BVE1_9GAMM|nr:helix-turn-helix transcriptional regulator [Solimonas terrae]
MNEERDQHSSYPEIFKHVSPREMQVIYLLILGRTTREIGAQLGLSPHTVNQYKVAVYEKLHVKGAVALVRHAVLDGWLGDIV